MLSVAAILLLYPLVVLSSHRLWNRERIFAKPRQWVRGVPGLNCEECNPFWIAFVWAVALPYIQSNPTLSAFYLAAAVYAPLRFAALAYPLLDNKPTQPKKCKTCGQGPAPHTKAAQRPKHLALFVNLPTWKQDDATIAGLMIKVANLLKTGEWYVKVIVPNGTDMGSVAAYYIDIQKTTGLDPKEAMDTVVIPIGEGIPQQIGHLQKHLMLMGNGLLLAFDNLVDPQKETLDKAGALRGFRTLYAKPFDCAETPYDQFISWLTQQHAEAVTRKT
jgi:hypothetical protein